MKRYDWNDIEEFADTLFDEYEYMIYWIRDAWNLIMFERPIIETNSEQSPLTINDKSDILLWLISLYDLFYDYQVLIEDQEGVGEYEASVPGGYQMKDYNAKNLGGKIQSIDNWEELISEFFKEVVHRKLLVSQNLFLDQDSCISDYETIPEQTNCFENLLDYTIDSLLSEEIRKRREECRKEIYRYFSNNEVEILFFMAGYHARDHYTVYKQRLNEIETWEAEARELFETQMENEEDPDLDESDIEWEYNQKIEELNDEFPVSIRDLDMKVSEFNFDYFAEIGPIYDWISRRMD